MPGFANCYILCGHGPNGGVKVLVWLWVELGDPVWGRSGR